MKLNELIASHVAGTTLDSASLKEFLQTPPHYYQWGINHQIDQTSLTQLDATDLFEFYLRLYLIGRHKTLRACLREARSFAQQDAQAAHYFLGYSLEDTRQRLLLLEWYELLPRLDLAKEKILLLVPDLDYPVRPLIIRSLEESY
ncbi:hypothetical protein [Spirosoma flavum]|uniref:Uncharacterized protein n=1 Tax=Spirosoma flavum TaxID=2048557 RepID=A0ABW6AML7_9BACT